MLKNSKFGLNMAIDGNSPRKRSKKHSNSLSPIREGGDLVEEGVELEHKVDADSEPGTGFNDKAVNYKNETELESEHKKATDKQYILKEFDGIPISDNLVQVSEEYLQTFILQTFGKSSSKVYDVISNNGKLISFGKNDKILECCNLNENLFIIIEGIVDILTSDNLIKIARLHNGSIFGEVSMLYDVPCTANVRANTACNVVYIHKSRFLSLLEDEQSDIGILDLFVKRRYLPTSQAVEAPWFYRRFTLHILKELPFFTDMTNDVIKRIIMKIDHTPVILYPKRSKLILENDPLESIFILVEGSIEVISGNTRVTTIDVGKENIPFVYGMTGLLINNTASVHTLRAIGICKVIELHRGWVRTTMKRYPFILDKCIELETPMRTMRSAAGSLYHKHKEHLQFDLLYHSLASAEYYRTRAIYGGLLQRKLLDGILQEFDKEQKILHTEDDNKFEAMLVVCGMVLLKTNNTIGKNEKADPETECVKHVDRGGLQGHDVIEYQSDEVINGGNVICLNNRSDGITMKAYTQCLVLKIYKDETIGSKSDTSGVDALRKPNEQSATDSLEFV